MKTTELENQMLDAIAHSDYTPLNGATPEVYGDAWTWLFLDEMADTMNCSVEAAKGVLTNLKKKGLVTTADEGTADASIYFTAEGFEIFKANLDQREEKPMKFNCPNCEKSFDSQRALNTHLGRWCKGTKEADLEKAIETGNDVIEMDEATEELKKETNSDFVKCFCGCGTKVSNKKKFFLQGHDMKLKSRVVKNLKAGEAWDHKLAESQKSYVKVSWSRWLDKAKENHTSKRFI